MKRFTLTLKLPAGVTRADVAAALVNVAADVRSSGESFRNIHADGTSHRRSPPAGRWTLDLPEPPGK